MERAKAVSSTHPSPPKSQRSPDLGVEGSMISSPEVILKSELPDADVVMIEPIPTNNAERPDEHPEKLIDMAFKIDEKAPKPEIVASDATLVLSESTDLATDSKPDLPSAPDLTSPVPRAPSPSHQAPSPTRHSSPNQQQNAGYNVSNVVNLPATDVDFESMFDDIGAERPSDGASQGVTDLNFDLDFSADTFANTNDNAVLDLNGGGTAAAHEKNATTDQPSEDINTLLPGLENLVGDSSGIGDISMMDFTATNAAGSIGATDPVSQVPPTQGDLSIDATDAGLSIQAPAKPSHPGATAAAAAAVAPVSDLDDLFNFATDASSERGAGANIDINNLGDSTFDDLLGSDWGDGVAGGSGEVKLTDFEDWFKDAP